MPFFMARHDGTTCEYTWASYGKDFALTKMIIEWECLDFEARHSAQREASRIS